MEKFCQSCGMILKDHQGTNADGSLSMEYCSYCWENGMFLQANIQTAKEMQQFVYNVMRKEYKMFPPMAWFFTLMIPSLKRWKNKR